MLRMPKHRGFTLIELLVVVVIIGILAAVAIPQFSGAQDKAKNSAVVANVHTVQLSVQSYAVDNSDAFPDTLADLASGSKAVYLPDGGIPHNPWGKQFDQLLTTNIVASTASAQFSLGLGHLQAPTKLTDYSAIAYTVSGSAKERYDLSGTGKRGDYAIVISQIHN